MVIMSNSIQKSIMDIPDEILEENLLTLLSFNDLRNWMKIDNARLFRCCHAVIKKKPSCYLKKEWFKNAREGKLEDMKYICKIIKEKGFEEDIKHWRGFQDRTILMEATLYVRPNVLRWLLQEFQFDVNEQDSRGDTALHYAACYFQIEGRIECARLLLDQGSLLLKNQNGDIYHSGTFIRNK